ncbi:hypothetical protein HaLaN_29389, partial [Haematococcus lacustris]
LLAAALVTAPPHQVAAAFAGLDLDGSGALDPAKLSAGLQLYGDSGQRDGRLSLAELTVLLEPFTT